jgi:hypothetical protein
MHADRIGWGDGLDVITEWAIKGQQRMMAEEQQTPQGCDDANMELKAF